MNLINIFGIFPLNLNNYLYALIYKYINLMIRTEMESDEQRRERIHLIREVKLSKLILDGKKNELNNEKNRTDILKKNIEDTQIENNATKENIEKLKEEIKKINEINANIERENNNKLLERQNLFEELKFGEPQPADDQEQERDEDDFENDYEIEEIK